MNILINASNLKAGGGLQVADSICRELYKFQQHVFIVVLSSYLKETYSAIKDVSNVRLYVYDIENNFNTLILGRDSFLDSLVINNNIDSVLTVFGPSRWNPKVPHLSGFALSQLLIPESPFFKIIGLKDKIWFKVYNNAVKIAFKRSGKNFYTENPFISERLQALFPHSSVYTVTNYYNQVFDNEGEWRQRVLPEFDGVTLLTIATPYIHKNVTIAADVARLLREQHPGFQFRFVFSFERKDFRVELKGIEDCFLFIGKVDISECPSLYQQSDIVFVPTLIECFTAAYPEAMRMKRPIITTDLEFAHGLCGEAAFYYSALDPQSCADAIYNVATNVELTNKLVNYGSVQLGSYDNYHMRAKKLIETVEIL